MERKESNASDLLKKLLAETTPENKMDNMENIQKLINKTVTMNKMATERTQKVEEYFKTIKERIDASQSYLDKAKKDIDNIKTSIEKKVQDNKNSETYLEFMKKSDEEIDDEMHNIRMRLSELQVDVEKYKFMYNPEPDNAALLERHVERDTNEAEAPNANN